MAGYGDEITALCDMSAQRMDATMRGTVLEATSRVVIRTPVDEGRARGDWQITVDTLSRGSTDDVDPTGAKTIAAAVSILPAGQTAGKTVYLTNTMPYIRRLEQGHSKQGSHMIERTVNELPEIVDKAAQAARAAYP